jgi:ketosteroid isomerase-like protein
MNTPSTTAVDLTALLGAIDRLDAARFGEFLSEDASYTFSNFDTVVGREAIVESAAAFFETVSALHHEILDVVTDDKGGFAVRVAITFDLPDGRSLTLPAVIFTRTSDGAITDHRVFINETPLAG